MLKKIIFTLLSVVALAASHATAAAEQETAVVEPAQVMQDTPPAKEAEQQTAVNTRPINDNHVDYRYCLELKTDLEIIKCRYKK